MSVSITGKVERRDLGMGAWALVSDTGETYELMDPPEKLYQCQDRVKVEGQIRDNVMTIAMIGPVLEVTSFSVIT